MFLAGASGCSGKEYKKWTRIQILFQIVSSWQAPAQGLPGLEALTAWSNEVRRISIWSYSLQCGQYGKWLVVWCFSQQAYMMQQRKCLQAFFSITFPFLVTQADLKHSSSSGKISKEKTVVEIAFACCWPVIVEVCRLHHKSIDFWPIHIHN